MTTATTLLQRAGARPAPAELVTKFIAIIIPDIKA